MLDLSIVIPVRDEEENVAELVDRIVKTMSELGAAFEVIFVTDINRDNTLGALKAAHQRDERIKSIKLSNGFGQHVAILAGLHHATGDAVLIMDGDLQDYPEDIPILYHTYREGYDVVYATKEIKNESRLRNFFSASFIRILNKLSDFRLDFNTCMFRIMSRRTVAELLKFKEVDPTLNGIVSLIGFPTTKVLVTSGKRKRGKTKYSYLRQINIAISFLLSFSTKPLRLSSMFGIFISSLSFIYLLIVIIQKLFFRIGILGWPTIISLITFLGGIQLLSLGIIGEYLGKVFMETKDRPRYFIEEKIGDL